MQWRGSPLKTDLSDTVVPIPSELALELSAAVARWPGSTVVTNGAGEPASPWAIERAVRAAREKACPRRSDSTTCAITWPPC